jgi:TetR/AcrR family transcriptional repressor of nem operon
MGGCPAAALVGEITRHSKGTREAFVSDIKKMISLIEARVPKTKSAAARANTALAIFSIMIGALQFARVTTDASLSKKILQASKEAALALAKL